MAYVIPTVKAAIITALGNRAALNNVPKLYAPPTEIDDVKWSGIWLGEEVKADDDWAQLGAQSRRVVFRVPFVIMAVTEGDDPQATDTQAWGYFEEFSAALRANPTLGAPSQVQQFDLVTSTNRVVPTGPKTWEASISGQVVVTSRSY